MSEVLTHLCGLVFTQEAKKGSTVSKYLVRNCAKPLQRDRGFWLGRKSVIVFALKLKRTCRQYLASTTVTIPAKYHTKALLNITGTERVQRNKRPAKLRLLFLEDSVIH